MCSRSLKAYGLAVSVRKRLSRDGFMRYLQALPEPAVVIMEACGTAHYWGRMARSLGHEVTLLHARYVKLYANATKPIATIAMRFWSCTRH